jgi:hypothetical protein
MTGLAIMTVWLCFYFGGGMDALLDIADALQRIANTKDAEFERDKKE